MLFKDVIAKLLFKKSAGKTWFINLLVSYKLLSFGELQFDINLRPLQFKKIQNNAVQYNTIIQYNYIDYNIM